MMTDVTYVGLQEEHTFSDKVPLLMWIVEEANLFGVRIKIVQCCLFSVIVLMVIPSILAYYTTTSLQRRVMKCITCTGRMAHNVFNDASVLGAIMEGNPDEAPCHPQVPMEEEVTAILGKET